VTFITHNKAVEELMHHQAQTADCDAADRKDEVKVSQDLFPWFGKRTMVTDDADGQNDIIQNLTFSITSLEQHPKVHYICVCQPFLSHVPLPSCVTMSFSLSNSKNAF